MQIPEAKTSSGTDLIHTENVIDKDTILTPQKVITTEIPPLEKTLPGWKKWLSALKAVLPMYLITRVGFLLLEIFFVTFLNGINGPPASFHDLLRTWDRWDTGYYKDISVNGYTDPTETAFFPLFPILIRLFSQVTHLVPLTSGLIVSNLAALVMLVALYRLVEEDFDSSIAYKSALALSFFPTAFFFVAVYTESLFISLCLLSFYFIRRGNWWLAGLLGLFATLSRSSGIFLIIPFIYEYLQQHRFRIKSIRIDVLSMGLFPIGLAIFSFYCYQKFGDPLAFSHAQQHWQRAFHMPWHGTIEAITIATQNKSLLMYNSLHNWLDIGSNLFFIGLVLLTFVGPWRFPRSYWSYNIFAVAIFIFFLIFPIHNENLMPLSSTTRFLLEMFPAFIILAKLSKSKSFELAYYVFSGALLFFLVTQFWAGGWVA